MVNIDDIKKYIESIEGTFIKEHRSKDTSGTMRTFINYTCKNGHNIDKRHDRIVNKKCVECIGTIDIDCIKKYIESVEGTFIKEHRSKDTSGIMRTFINYICKNGHNIDKRHDYIIDKLCVDCLGTIDLSGIKKYIESVEGTFIKQHRSKDTSGTMRTLINYTCKNGHDINKRHDRIIDTQCVECLGTIDLDGIKKYIESVEGTFIKEHREKDTSGTMRTLINYTCKNGHDIDKRHDYIINLGCNDCRTTIDIDSIKKYIESVGGTFIKEHSSKDTSGTMRTFINYTCKNGHDIDKRHDYIIYKQCINCIENDLFAYKRKYTYDYYNEIITNKKGTIITNKEEFKNAETKFKFLCEEKHECEMSGYSLNDGRWCIECNTSINERTCRSIFEYLFNVKFNKNKSIIINNKTGKYLELDGYNDQLKIAFEYNGEQHYKAIPYFGGTEKLINQQEKDSIKLKYCEENGINLIVIPYTINYENLYSFIIEKFPDKNFEKNIDYTVLNMTSKNKERIKEIQNEVDKYGGQLLSTNYINTKTLMQFKCKNGHIFNKNFDNIKHGHFCIICNKNQRINDFINKIKLFCNSKNFELISEYKGYDLLCHWKCKICNKIFNSSWSNFKNRKAHCS